MRCWICASPSAHLVRPSTLPQTLSAADFKITDASYGTSAAIYRCDACGFLYCPETPDVLSYYEGMADEEYENTRPQRLLQAAQLLRPLLRHKPSGRFLDVGAGTGIMVEAAAAAGYRAQGVEPSSWLQAQAAKRGLDVKLGVLPHPDIQGTFDVVTAVDVIEHVNDPLGLMRTVAAAMAPDAVGMVVTPDAASLVARLLGRNWWHYRPAHISYFTETTLKLALRNAGLEPIVAFRPGWYFPASYLFERVMQYVPRPFRVTPPGFLSRVTVPLNLFDSLTILFRKA